MKKTHFDASWFVAIFLSACTPAVPAYRGEATPTAPSRVARREVQDAVDRIREKYNLPGLAAAVVRTDGSSWLAVSGVRQVDTQDKIDISDRFHIASCTKSMTAMLAAIAVHRGELRWSTRMVDVLPELATVVRPEFRTATLEELLAHRARMPAYTQFGPDRLEQLKQLPGSPPEQRLRFLRDVLSVEPPNDGVGDASYSNVGYTAAAAMFERAAGVPWETLLQSRLSQPLGMSSVHFGWPATSSEPRQPRGHYTRAGRVEPQPLDDSYMLPVSLWPAGAVNATIGDLGRYVADQLAGLRQRPALLPAAYYSRLHQTLDGSESGFTLGWGIRRDQRWGVVHYGAGSGGTFFVHMLIVPHHDVAVVAASNSGAAGAATRELINELIEGVNHQQKSGQPN